MAGSKLLTEVMSETISYGGFALPRWKVYEDALAITGSSKIADMYAFSQRARALSPAEIPYHLTEQDFDTMRGQEANDAS